MDHVVFYAEQPAKAKRALNYEVSTNPLMTIISFLGVIFAAVFGYHIVEYLFSPTIKNLTVACVSVVLATAIVGFYYWRRNAILIELASRTPRQVWLTESTLTWTSQTGTHSLAWSDAVGYSIKRKLAVLKFPSVPLIYLPLDGFNTEPTNIENFLQDRMPAKRRGTVRP